MSANDDNLRIFAHYDAEIARLRKIEFATMQYAKEYKAEDLIAMCLASEALRATIAEHGQWPRCYCANCDAPLYDDDFITGPSGDAFCENGCEQ